MFIIGWEKKRGRRSGGPRPSEGGKRNPRGRGGLGPKPGFGEESPGASGNIYIWAQVCVCIVCMCVCGGVE